MGTLKQVALNYYIRPTYIVCSPEYDKCNKGRSIGKRKSLQNLNDNKHKGILSKSAAKKLSNAIDWLVISAPLKRVYSKKENKTFYFRCNFITLTVPEQNFEIPSKTLTNKLLPKLIDSLKYKYQLKNYVWVVELQSNNMPHIHITTDTFIHHDWLRNKWNSILYKEGLLNTHYEKFGNYTPPSTEVKSVKNAKKIHKYLSSYVSNGLKKYCKSKYGDCYSSEQLEEAKQTFKRIMNGRLWGCNYELSVNNKLHYSVMPFEDDHLFKSLKEAKIEHKEILSKPDYMNRQYWLGNIWKIKLSDWKYKIKGVLYELMKNHVIKIRNKADLFMQELNIEIESFLNPSGISFKYC
jgi:hypothetical protein